MKSADRVISSLLLLFVSAAGLAIVGLVDPANPLFPRCPWRAVTGWLCPGCGTARAMHALLHGHVLTALQFNPIAVAAVPMVATDLLQGLKGGGWMRNLRPAYIWGLAVVLVLFGVVRNLGS